MLATKPTNTTLVLITLSNCLPRTHFGMNPWTFIQTYFTDLMFTGFETISFQFEIKMVKVTN